jgi:DNA-binding NarL/FixJ family response regulator
MTCCNWLVTAGNFVMMRSTQCPLLIGRDSELQALTVALDETSAGRGDVVFLTGDHGVGKSRLAREVAQLAASRGFDALTGRAVESAVPVPYRPIGEALMRLARYGQVPGGPDLADYRPALGTLVPEWSRGSGDTAEISPVILGEAVLRLLTLRETPGTMLILEDLHWADPETLAIIEYLADNLGGTRVFCLATLRGEPSEGLDLARSATARRVATTVEVPRLGRQAVAQMAAACLGAEVAPDGVTGRILANCDGLPFAVEELLAAAIASGELTSGAAGWEVNDQISTGLPASIVESVWNRLAVLGRSATEILIFAAVVGKRFDWTLLPSMAGAAEHDVLAALQHALEAQLIKPIASDSRTFAFRHSLTRSAILSSLLPPDLAARSASAAAAIEAAHPGLAGPWCERAAELHAAAGNMVQAARLQLEAGRRAKRLGALSSAIASLRDAKALAAAAQPAEPELGLEIDEVLVRSLSLAGDYSQLAPIAEDLIARLDAAAADPRREAQVRVTIARTTSDDHSPAVAAHLARAREIAEELDDPALASQVDAAAAQCTMTLGDLDGADELARRALSIAEAASSERWAAVVAVDALQVIGRRERLRDFAAAEDAFQRAYRIATSNDLAISRIGALHELGTIDMLRESKTDRLFEARDLAQQAGALSMTTVIDLQLAHALTHGTDLDQALTCALRCEQGARLRGARRLEAFALCAQAIIRGVQADRRAAERAAQRAELLLPGDPELLLSTWGTARVTASLFLDDPRRALRESVAGMSHSGPVALTLPRRAWSYYALLHVIHDENADEAVKRARQAGAAAGWSQGYLAFADAVLAGRDGQPERATALAAAASAHLTPYAPRWTHLAHRLVAADAIKDGWGDPAAWLRAAAAEFEATGYQRLASTCRGLLRRTGERVPRVGRGDTPVPVQMRRLGITSREMDVFLLVARGLSNAEIAELLYISPKTVETHVASLVAKTGQAGRRQLVAHAAGEYEQRTDAR